MKFGGSSLANAAKIRNAARVVERFSPENRIVVVASAMDDTTDRLVELGELARRGESARASKILSRIQKLHTKTAQATSSRKVSKELLDRIDRLNKELEKTVQGISHLRELTPRSRDYLLSFGERLSTPILAATASAIGLRARSFTGAEAGITTDDNFGEAKPLLETSYHQIRQRLEPLWNRRIVPIVTGFIASTVDGSVTTLGRGGSDYTAALLRAAVGAEEIWIWTDVDGF